MDAPIRTIARFIFTGLLGYELLNYFGILHRSLDFTWAGLALTSGGVFCLLECISWRMRKRSGVSLSGKAFFLAALLITADALGDILHWYGEFLSYDQIMHFGGGAVGFLILDLLITQMASASYAMVARKILSFFALTLTVFLGALYEIEEYLEDMLTGSHRLGDGFDTANDLLLNMLGALSVLLFLQLLQGLRKKSTVSE